MVALSKNLLVISIDRLHAGLLGPWGNSWIRTPTFNRLAAESLLLDQAVIDSPELDRLLRAWWQGLHAMQPDPANSAASLPALLTAAGYQTALLSDDAAVINHPLAAGFARRTLIATHSATERPEELEETGCAQFFAAALAEVAAIVDAAESQSPVCLWLHTAALGISWDAPDEFSQQYQEEDDPDLPEGLAPPCSRLPKEFDPDELLVQMHRYAGQVSLLDACLGLLLDDFLAGPLAANTLLVVLGARGFPLGEHGRLGPVDDALYGELLSVPALLRFPAGTAAALRSSALVQPSDLFATAAAWCELANVATRPFAKNLLTLANNQSLALRDRACTVNTAAEQAIRTAGWFLRASGEVGELFALPDDRHQVNEVANRCPDVALALRAALAEFQQTASSAAEQPPELTALPESLVESL